MDDKDERILVIDRGGRYSFYGPVYDRFTPYYQAQAYRFLEAFVKNTPTQSLEAFHTCMLAEKNGLYPQNRGNEKNYTFPKATRAERQRELDKHKRKQAPFKEQISRVTSEILVCKREIRDVESGNLNSQYTPEELRNLENTLAKKVVELEKEKETYKAHFDRLAAPDYKAYYDPNHKKFQTDLVDPSLAKAKAVRQEDMDDLRERIGKEAEKYEEEAAGEVPHFVQNLTAMAADLGLNDKELKLMILLHVLDEDVRAKAFFNAFFYKACGLTKREANTTIARMIGAKPEEMDAIIGPESNLIKQGLITFDDELLGKVNAETKSKVVIKTYVPNTSQIFARLLKRPNVTYDALKKQLFGTVQKTDLKWPDDFDYVDEKFHSTIPNEILGHKVHKERFLTGEITKPPEGLPYMFVGPTRSGKSEAAIALAEHCGMKPILIGQNMTIIDEEGKEQNIDLNDAERIRQAKAAVNKYKNATDVILILDEFDDLFPKNVDYHGSDEKTTHREDKGAERSEFQDLIKHSGLPMIFTSNVDSNKVHPAVIARMTQLVTVEMPSAKSRRRIALRRLSDHGIAVKDEDDVIINEAALQSFGHADPKKYLGTISSDELNELARFEVMSGEISQAIYKARNDAEGLSYRTRQAPHVDFALLEKHFVMTSNQNHGEVNLSDLDELHEGTAIADADPVPELDLEQYHLKPSTPLPIEKAIAGYTKVLENRVKGVVIDGPGDDKTKLAKHIITRMELAAVVVQPKNISASLSTSQQVDEIFRKAKAEGKAVIFTEEGTGNPHKAKQAEATAPKPDNAANGKNGQNGNKNEEDQTGFSEDTLRTIQEKAKQHQVFVAMVLDKSLKSGMLEGPNAVFNFHILSQYLKKNQLEKVFEEKTGVKPEDGTFNGLGSLTAKDVDAALFEARTFGADEFQNDKRNFKYLRDLLERRNNGRGSGVAA